MEDFVTFEIAKKLKEKGFDYPCITHYDINKELKVVLSEPIFWHSDVLSYTDAPTISQVLKWLREEKNIYISIFIDDDSDHPVTYEIYKDTECMCTHHGEYFALNDWSKCELRAIEYVIDNLIS